MNTFEIVRLIGKAPKELLNGMETCVLTRLAFFGNREGKDIRPGLKELVSQLKFSRRVVIKVLNSLVEKGALLDRTTIKYVKGSESNYEINLSFLKGDILTGGGARGAPGEVHHVHLSKPENRGGVVHVVHQGGARGAPGGGARGAPLSNTPHILNPLLPSCIVELPFDSTTTTVEKKSKKSLKKTNSWTPQVMEVFQHWQKVLNHPGAKLDEHRRKYIVRMLEAEFSVEELKKAIEGVKNSAHNMGINDRKKKYDDFDVIFRNSKQVERFLRNFDTPEAPFDKNGATDSKTHYLERNRKSVDILSAYTAKMYPELAEFFPSKQSSKVMKLVKERIVNEHE